MIGTGVVGGTGAVIGMGVVGMVRVEREVHSYHWFAYFPTGDIQRAASDNSFGDPDERIIDAKLEGGKTIRRSKEREAAHQVHYPPTPHCTDRLYYCYM